MSGPPAVPQYTLSPDAELCAPTSYSISASHSGYPLSNCFDGNTAGDAPMCGSASFDDNPDGVALRVDAYVTLHYDSPKQFDGVKLYLPDGLWDGQSDAPEGDSMAGLLLPYRVVASASPGSYSYGGMTYDDCAQFDIGDVLPSEHTQACQETGTDLTIVLGVQNYQNPPGLTDPGYRRVLRLTEIEVYCIPPSPPALPPPALPPLASPPPPAGAQYECAFLRDDEAVTTADAGEVLEVRLQTTDTTLTLQEREIRNFNVDGSDLVLSGCTLVPDSIRNFYGDDQEDAGFLKAFNQTGLERLSLTQSIHFDVTMDEGATECTVTVRGSEIRWGGGGGDVPNTERSFAVAVAPAPAEGLSIGAIVAIIVAGLLLLGACIFLLVYFLLLARRDRECDEYSDEDERRECEEGDARERKEQKERSRRERERAALVGRVASAGGVEVWQISL